MALLPIGEIARRAGLQTSAVRYYESVGLLPAPERVNGQRRYDSDSLMYLAVIALAQKAGFTIAEMKVLFAGPNEESAFAGWDVLAQRKLAEMDAVIAQAQQMKVVLDDIRRCRCLSIETCTLLTHTGQGTRVETDGSRQTCDSASKCCRD